jgi:hypothetical protein
MTRSDDSRENAMGKGAETAQRRRAGKPPRAEAMSELPMVAALLVMAVVVALMAAGGPVLEMIAALDTHFGR